MVGSPTRRWWLNAVTTRDDLAYLVIEPAGVPVEVRSSGDTVRIDLPSGCQATLTENYASLGSEAYQRQSKLEIYLADDAKLTHYKIVQEGPQATHHSFMEVQVGRSAAFNSSVFLLAGAVVRNTIHVRLNEESAECSLNGLYLCTGTERSESHTLIQHRRTHGTSREFYKGILDGQSQGVFDGLIVVDKEAQKTDSAQTNRNLLLSNQAIAKSNPELKIFANDVKCKHGSTIGQIDPTHLFYMRSRGIPEAEARRLLVYAFASEMINAVPIVALKESLEQALFQKFEGMHV